jgi:HSP20 family protein
MAKLFPWDPWLELESLKEDMKRLAEDVSCPSPFTTSVRKITQFRPVADVIETEDSYLVLIELPGLDREDIFLEVLGNELSVYGERPVLAGLSNAAFEVMERSYGCFARRFSFARDIDPQAVRANMTAGLLRVVVPKCSKRSTARHLSIAVED